MCDRWEKRRGGMGVVGGEERRWSVQRELSIWLDGKGE